MKKPILVVAILLFGICLVGGVIGFHRMTNYYYSKKLVEAIRLEDVELAEQIVQKHPNAVDTFPSLTPRWWHALLGYRVRYPLNEACSINNMEIVQLLIEAGADVNCNDGMTPLAVVYSIKKDNWYQLSLYLIENGALLEYEMETYGKWAVFYNVVNRRSGSALPGYIPENEEEEAWVYSIFCDALTICNRDEVDWQRVFCHCVSKNRIEIMRMLLDEGYCDVNTPYRDMTPLMFAARDADADMVTFLLERGADKNAVTDDGETAYDIAVRYNRDAVIPLLED